jgi:hypothetical protein
VVHPPTVVTPTTFRPVVPVVCGTRQSGSVDPDTLQSHWFGAKQNPKFSHGGVQLAIVHPGPLHPALHWHLLIPTQLPLKHDVESQSGAWKEKVS